MTQSNAWFYSANQQPVGPVTYEQIIQLIRTGTIQRQTFLWHEGLAQWQPAHLLILPWPIAQNSYPPVPPPTPAPAAYNPHASFTDEPAYPAPDWIANPPLYNDTHFRLPFRRMIIWLVIAFVLMVAGFIICVIGLVASENQQAAPDFPVEIIPGLGILFLAVLSYIASLINQMTLVYRYWNLIRDIRPDVTPGTAVGFLFIPFFNLYWIFRAYAQLPKDLNRYLLMRQIPAPRANEGIALTYCILSLCSMIPYLGSLVALISLVFYFIMLADFNRTAIAIAHWQQQQMPQPTYSRRF